MCVCVCVQYLNLLQHLLVQVVDLGGAGRVLDSVIERVSQVHELVMELLQVVSDGLNLILISSRAVCHIILDPVQHLERERERERERE